MSYKSLRKHVTSVTVRDNVHEGYGAGIRTRTSWSIGSSLLRGFERGSRSTMRWRSIGGSGLPLEVAVDSAGFPVDSGTEPFWRPFANEYLGAARTHVRCAGLGLPVHRRMAVLVGIAEKQEAGWRAASFPHAARPTR